MGRQVSANAGPVVLVGAEAMEKNEDITLPPFQIGKLKVLHLESAMFQASGGPFRPDQKPEGRFRKQVIEANQAENEDDG